MHIRAARIEDAQSIAKVHVDTWRTTYNGIVSDEYLSNLSYERSAAGYAGRFESGVYSDSRELLLVGENADAGVIGFVIGGPERDGNKEYDAEIYAIYLLKDWQQQGFGKQLFFEMAHLLSLQGRKSLLVWVLSENKSRGFYESIGGVLVGEKDIVIDGIALKEVAYGWPDLSTFSKEVNARNAGKVHEILYSPENIISGKIIGAAIEVHRILGPGLLESVYEEALCEELLLRDIRFERQKAVPIIYKSKRLKSDLRLDLLVEEMVVTELKSKENVTPIDREQVLTYLRLSGKKLGLILNFNVPRMVDGIGRIVNDLPEE